MKNLELEILKRFSKDLENIDGYDNIGRRIHDAVKETSLNDNNQKDLRTYLNKTMQEAIKQVKDFRPILQAIIKDNVGN